MGGMNKILTCGNCPYAWKYPVGNWYTSRKYPICGEDFRHMRQHSNSQPQWCPLKSEMKGEQK